MKLESYKDLIVWQKSIKLVYKLYQITYCFPKEELYCLTSQMRRAAISILSNIAEGYKRKGLGEYLRFLNIAEASAAELETQIIIAKGLYKKIDFLNIELLLVEIQKILFVMIRNLKGIR
ncbi:MAG: four helix bundle protein [Patescibacteria group bacterium]